MADATLQILGLGTRAVPLDYNVTGNQPLDLIAVKADFDGSAAAVDFVPVIQILSDADHVMAQAKGPTVTAGDSATVTFAPFLEDAGGSATATGALKYVTYPQTGTWFYADVTGSGGPDGWGWEVVDVNGNGTVFKGVPFLAGDVDQVSNGAWFYLRSTGFQLGITNNQHYRLTTGVGHIFDGFVNFAGPQLGFFGVTPVVQQATPVTLADVIALLQAYGLAV